MNFSNYTLAYPAPPDGDDELSVPYFIYAIIGVLAAAENAVAILIVISSKRFRKKRNVFLFSLTLADFTVGILSFLVYFETFYKSNMFGSILDAMFLVSMISISAVCIERYIAIVAAPFTYKHIVTFKKCIIVCFLYWVLTIVIVIGVYSFTYDKWTRLAFCIVTLITILANYILYFKISRVLSANDHDVTQNLGQNVIGRSKRLIQSFIILLVIATVCWLPLCCFYIIAVFSKSVDENAYVLNVLYCVSLCNSFINPYIYWYRLPGMKEALRSLVCCIRTVPEKDDDHTRNPTTSTAVTAV
ncbi:melanocortin receptor 5-like [Antedon mediterranea]|uniref:melanocortin receptor 5-like n=1 Tax=Antedon mediterranea TaxID=105859 RepID=UPI003AF85A01